MVDKVLEVLKKHETATPSQWKEAVEWRKANKGWLKYSRYIAIRVLSRMDELQLTQNQLAQKMDCSQQYISKILKGKENLSLESIWKIENVLELDLVKSALGFVDGYSPKENPFHEVADPNLVSGYGRHNKGTD